MRLVLIEDDYDFGSALKKTLEKYTYGVDWFRTGDAGFDAIAAGNYLALILDLNLPGMNGFEIVSSLRKSGSDLPILILTAMDDQPSRLHGLELGADDCLVKPFDAEELLARVRALTRRPQFRLQSKLQWGNISLYPHELTVYRDDEELHLSHKEKHLLRLLMEYQDRYLSKNDLEYALYDCDNLVESNMIEVLVYSLRKKLGGNCIKCARGIGYRLRTDETAGASANHSHVS
ncbi:response regulator transcription factor [Oryzifoliimicrobium ureilyticus]|uniref:response regulator transcription factor n=1 Tax=Oryzifoliimicrobium ureilyticus TaxID=3113724 RepID=UPI003076569F